jgi:DNA recombination protein RmuC
MDNSFLILLTALISMIISAVATWIITKRIQEKHLTSSIDTLQALHQVDVVQLQERLQSLEDDYAKNEQQSSNYTNEIDLLRRNLQSISNNFAVAQEQNKEIPILKQEKREIAEKYDILMREKQKMAADIAHLTTKLQHEQLQNHEKIELLQESRKQLEDSFKVLAQDIFEEKSKRFTEQNQSNLFQLLEPLKTQIVDFKSKVEQAYEVEGKERSALSQQVKEMMHLNQQLSKDANNLARALKGDNKIQGNWGELILEKVLETGGLRKGHEYKIQESHTNSDGKRIQPDVVIYLPANRYVVIDAKASISAYNDYLQADNDILREQSLKKHIDSIRNHIKNLSDKNYQNIHDDKSPDFVLMFIPIEPAFMLAISNDTSLWNDAWQKNILLVSPSTLLFVIRMIAQIWRSEYQSQNTKDIVKRGAELYDKLVGFVDDMQKIGEYMGRARDSYDKAYNKFKTGKGNLIRQAEMLKELGVKPTKQLPEDVLDISLPVDLREEVINIADSSTKSNLE